MSQDTDARDKAASEHALERFPIQNIETVKGFTQDVNFARRMTHKQAFRAGWIAKAAHDKEKLQKLVDALRWYADSYNYGVGNGLSWEHCEYKLIGEDQGRRARFALEEFEK